MSTIVQLSKKCAHRTNPNRRVGKVISASPMIRFLGGRAFRCLLMRRYDQPDIESVLTIMLLYLALSLCFGGSNLSEVFVHHRIKGPLVGLLEG